MDPAETENKSLVGNEENCAMMNSAQTTMLKGAEMLREKDEDAASRVRGKEIDVQGNAIVQTLEDIDIAAEDDDDEGARIVEEVKDDDSHDDEDVEADIDEGKLAHDELASKDESEAAPVTQRAEETIHETTTPAILTLSEESDGRAALFALVALAHAQEVEEDAGLVEEEHSESADDVEVPASLPPAAQDEVAVADNTAAPASKPQDAASSSSTKVTTTKATTMTTRTMTTTTTTTCNWKEGSEARGALFALAALASVAALPEQVEEAETQDLPAEEHASPAEDGAKSAGEPPKPTPKEETIIDSAEEQVRPAAEDPEDLAKSAEEPSKPAAQERDEVDETAQEADVKVVKRVNFEEQEQEEDDEEKEDVESTVDEETASASEAAPSKAPDAEAAPIQARPVEPLDHATRECSCTLL